MTPLKDAEDWEFAQMLAKYLPDYSESLESIAGSLESMLEIYNVLNCDGARVLQLVLDEFGGYVVMGREADGTPYLAFCTGDPNWAAAPAAAEVHVDEKTPMNVRLFKLHSALRPLFRPDLPDELPF